MDTGSSWTGGTWPTDDFLTTLSDFDAAGRPPGSRQHDTKQCTRAGFAFQLDTAAVRFDCPARDREPKAHATVVSRASRIHAIEPIEYVLLMIDRDARPRILHGDCGLTGGPPSHLH